MARCKVGSRDISKQEVKEVKPRKIWQYKIRIRMKIRNRFKVRVRV